MEESITEVVLRLPEDIHKLCRTCLNVADGNKLPCHEILIFNEFNALTEVAEMLQSCSSLKIKPEEGLPMSICDDCANKLEIAYNFRHQCEKTDISLRKIMDMPTPDLSEEEDIEVKKEISSPKETSSRSLIFYDRNSCKTDKVDVSEQVDLSQLYAQRKTVIDKYIINDDIETQIETAHKIKRSDDIYSLIQQRKVYSEENYEEKVAVNELGQSDAKDKSPIVEYVCTLCQKKFNSEDKYSSHVCVKKVKLEENDDSGENFPPFECHVCGKNFKTKHARKLHVANHEISGESIVNGVHVCDLCNKHFRTETKLAAHFYHHAKLVGRGYKKDENDEKFEYACYVCTEIYASVDELEEHMKSEHKKNGKVTCEICSQEFTEQTNFIIHLTKHGIRIMFCKICLKKFDDVQKLQMHEKTHKDDSKGAYKCPICKEEFSTASSLKDHSVMHLNETYKCEKCKRTFNNIISYDTHVKQHSEPKFLCYLCGKQYFSSVTLACHLRSHNNEKPFICNHCNKGFSSRATLSVHKRIHSSFKPYICSYCSYSCRQSGDLAMHIRTHTGDKPYKCTFPNCDRRFTTSSQRREHYRRHTNERNHKCKVCGKAFLESKTLKVHMLTHTGEKPHCCEVCGKKFRRTHHLTNHIKGHINYSATQEDIQIFDIV